MEKCGCQKVLYAQRISTSLTYFFADGPSPLTNKLRKDSKTMLWENAEKKKWRLQLRQVAVKSCGRFLIIRKSVVYFKSSRKVKSKQGALNFILIDLIENHRYCLYNL